ncbi:MAG TPA: hypothetical protein VLA74_01250, partial [Nitrososphaeraceae archaeon]|nr:hypothetical protein [Nitrososphaeraceae archaeon]
LKLLIKEKYLPILLIILLFLNINILSYNHIVLGKETDNDDVNNRDSREEDVIIEKDEEEDDVPFILPFNAVPFP